MMQYVQQKALSLIFPRENTVIVLMILIVKARQTTLLLLSLFMTFLRAIVAPKVPIRSPEVIVSIFSLSMSLLLSIRSKAQLFYSISMQNEESQADKILTSRGALEVQKFKKEFVNFPQSQKSSLELLKEKTLQLLFGLKDQQIAKCSLENLNPFKSVSYQIDNPTQSPICSKNIKLCIDGVAYRCYDCMECESSILCESCFVAGNHQNHRFRRLQGRTGCCDCGDIQVWNEKGFCNQHRKQTKLPQVDEKLRTAFLEDFKFAFFVYFWLYHRSKDETNGLIQATDQMRVTFSAYRKQYGSFLFNFLLKFVDESIQSKTLCYELLLQKIQSSLVNNHNQTILEQIFRIQTINNDSQLSKFTQLLNSLPSVTACKQDILKIYFEQTFRIEFPFSHPMRKINFQYLTSVKMMNSMIVAGYLKPLQLDQTKEVKDLQHLESCFKKLYEDMHYINKMKAKAEFLAIHFKNTNIASMAFYRKYTQIGQEKYHINVDHFFLKTLGYMVSSIRQDKPLLEKGIRELTTYIVHQQKSQIYTSSLAQQRALALYLTAYYDGNISRLTNRQETDNLLKLFPFDLTNETIEKALYKFICRSLVNTVYSQIEDTSRTQKRNSFEEWFFSAHPQRHFLVFLDSIYNKSLLLISKHYLQYNEIVEQSFEMIVDSKSSIPNKIHEIETFTRLLCFLGSVELDELAVSVYLNCWEKERVFKFYKQLRATYVYLSPKEFKTIAVSILNNPSLFDTFMLDHPELVQGRKVEGDYEEALPTILYKDLATKDDAFQGKVHLLRSNPILPTYQNTAIFNKFSIDLILQAIQELNNNPSIVPNKKSEQIIKQSLYSSLVLIYLSTNSEKIKQYFQRAINYKKDCFDVLPQSLREQINIVFSSQAQEKEQRDRMKEMEVKKKERMLAKKKQKEEMMKKNQAEFLKAYEQKEVKPTLEGLCIYCKEDNGDTLCYIAHCNLTNLLQQRILGQKSCHVFFNICGHKIHNECFKANISKNQIKKCILCRKESNFTIPIMSHQTDRKEAQLLLVEQFIQNLYLILLQYNEDRQETLQLFYGNECSYNVVYMLLISVVKEMFMFGVHSHKFISKMRSVYWEILSMLKLLPKEQIEYAFEIRRNNQDKMKVMSQNEEIIELIMKELHQFLNIGYREEENTIISMDVKTKIGKITKIIMGEPFTEQELLLCSFFDKRKFIISLPQTITNFTEYSGQCSFCKIYTNWMYICMTCGWKACSHESASFKQHTIEQHYSGAIFICSYNGNIAFFYDGRVRNDHSIYPNYLGEDYYEAGSSIIDNRVTDTYRLNREKFKEVERIMIEYEIPNFAKKSS